MFLKKVPNKKTGRIYLSIAHGYRDKEGKSKSKNIEKIGYLDELQKTLSDPIKHYTEYAKMLDAAHKQDKSLNITIHTGAVIERGTANVRNYGYIVLSKMYHELELDRFFNNMRRHERFKYNSESIMRLLAYSRVLYPNSKKKTMELKDRFFDNFDFSLDDIYDCLSHFSNCSGQAQRHMYQKVSELYGMDTSLVYYDVTNYYFETDKQDGYRMNGYSKQNRRRPIIQMGLAVDSRGIPMAFRTFPGNTNDSETYIESLKSIKKEYNVERAVVVADKGLNCGDNIAFSVALGDGYVFSQSVSGGSEELKAYVLNSSGYSEPTAEGFKKKSRVLPATVKITAGVTKSGRKSKKTVPIGDQKQVVFYSPKYAARAKKKREETLEKARELINNPCKYNSATHYGAAAYVDGIQIDKFTGELLGNAKMRLRLDTDKIRNEEKYDGYYAVITSEVDIDDSEVIDIYRGLWKIEDSFKLTKKVIKTRPSFVYLESHLEGHFLTCYIALLLIRLVELKLGNNFPAEKIVETLRDATCCYMEQNMYLFNYANEVTDAMNEAFHTDFGIKYKTLKDIRSAIGNTKRSVD